MLCTRTSFTLISLEIQNRADMAHRTCPGACSGSGVPMLPEVDVRVETMVGDLWSEHILQYEVEGTYVHSGTSMPNGFAVSTRRSMPEQIP